MKKVIVIIGASDGIGKTTLVKLLSENYKVYNLSRNLIEGLDTNIYCDVSSVVSINNAFYQLYSKEKAIDGFIYCAGFSMASTIEKVKEEDYRYLYEVILFGYIESLKCLLTNYKVFKVIFLSSLASSIPIPYDPYYCSAKAAVEVFNNTVNLELNKDSIYITNLIFGGVKTNFTYKRKVYEEEQNYDFYYAADTLAQVEQKGKDSLDISEAIFRILNMKKPPLNYVVGLKDKVTYKLSKILPSRIVNSLVKEKFKLKN